MRTRAIAAFLFAMIGVSGFAADPIAASKQTELLKLLHHTKELSTFRERVTQTLDGMREKDPTAPSWYWDEASREVNVNVYVQWIIAIYDRLLSEDDLRVLNTFYEDKEKIALNAEMAKATEGKKGQDFIDAVNEFKRSHDQSLVDEIVAFYRSSAVAHYSAAREEKEAGQRDKGVTLMFEACQRVTERHRKK